MSIFDVRPALSGYNSMDRPEVYAILHCQLVERDDARNIATTNLPYLLICQNCIRLLLSASYQRGTLARWMLIAAGVAFGMQATAISVAARQTFGMRARSMAISAWDALRVRARAMTLTRRHLTFYRRIGHVIGGGPEKQVGGITTQGIVATRAVVADVEAVGNRTARQLPRDAVCSHVVADACVPHDAVARGRATRPQPARVGLVNARPKTLREGGAMIDTHRGTSLSVVSWSGLFAPAPLPLFYRTVALHRAVA